MEEFNQIKTILEKFMILKNNDHHLIKTQKQPLRGISRKRCSENMQQTYRRTPTPECDFNNVAK